MNGNLDVKRMEAALQSAMGQGLIREEDTSVIFIDLPFLQDRISHLMNCFPRTTLHAAAIKANPLIRLLRIISRTGIGVEAATTGEIHIALEAGFPPSGIVYDSPVKTHADIEFALKTGVHINIDNLAELRRVSGLIARYGTSGSAGIRINPQVGTGTIAGSSVAGDYSKFGVPVKSGRKDLMDAFLSHPWLSGVHLHVGSQGCPMEMLLNGIGVLYDFVVEVNRERAISGIDPVSVFDIGGGLPVSYRWDAPYPSMEEYSRLIKDRFPLLFSDQFSLITEFGRWIFVNSGWVASRVEYVKHDPGIHTAMIHVGADLFLRECLNPQDWQHDYSVTTPEGRLKSGIDPVPYNLAGPLCFSGDILARQIELPGVSEGDYILIHDSGGYTFSMWSRYNSRQFPRILGYDKVGSGFIILRERESLKEIESFWG